MIPSSVPRYDRIISLVLVVVLGLAVVLLIDSNPNILRARLGGDLPTVTVSWLLIVALVVVASAGADLLARSHPQMQTRDLPTLNLGVTKVEITPGFWILPSFSVVGSFAFFRLFSGSLQGAAFMLALVAAGGLLLTVLLAQHYALDRNALTSRRAQLFLQGVTYVLAFYCFSAVYAARLRTLYAATFIGLTGLLLAYELFRWTPARRHMLLALLVGLILGEVTWALNYWAIPFLSGGAALLIIFYLAAGLVQHQLMGTLRRRVLLEYGLLGSGLLAAVVYITIV